MGMLDKLFGSDLDLKHPDFERSPAVEIDFSGTKISFKDPKHTAMFPINDVPRDMDIYDQGNFEEQDDGSFADRFYVKGWNLFGRHNKAHGAVRLNGLIKYYPALISSDNCFDKKSFQREIIQFAHRSWGWQNEGATLGSLGSGERKYPVSADELKFLNFTNVVWCHFSSKVKEKPPTIVYATPVSSAHIIFLEFIIDTYKGLRFYDAKKSNIKQASYQVIEDFMNNFHIELSDTPKKEQEAASEKLTA